MNISVTASARESASSVDYWLLEKKVNSKEEKPLQSNPLHPHRKLLHPFFFHKINFFLESREGKQFLYQKYLLHQATPTKQGLESHLLKLTKTSKTRLRSHPATLKGTHTAPPKRQSAMQLKLQIPLRHRSPECYLSGCNSSVWSSKWQPCSSGALPLTSRGPRKYACKYRFMTFIEYLTVFSVEA